jgi:aminoglycoside phosphotransferase (APT) family kinase protein
VSPRRMHEDEVEIDAPLVERLVAEQFPGWARLPLREVRSTATVNAIYRLGERLCVRLPRVREWARDLEKEWRWLPEVSTRVSLRVPEPLEMGRPARGYPFPWAVFSWIEGQPYSDGAVSDERRAARELAGFVRELRRMEPVAGAPQGGRKPLRDLDAMTREAIEASRDSVDSEAATAAWERALEAPEWDGEAVWVHADLLRPNVLVREGRIRAVIDFGGAGIGDPAADVIAAWSVFGPEGRAAFRETLDVEEGAWERARGFALHQAAMIVPYYRETNPEFAALARRTIGEVLSERQPETGERRVYP